MPADRPTTDTHTCKRPTRYVRRAPTERLVVTVRRHLERARPNRNLRDRPKGGRTGAGERQGRTVGRTLDNPDDRQANLGNGNKTSAAGAVSALLRVALGRPRSCGVRATGTFARRAKPTPAHICTATELFAATSAPRPGSPPLPHLNHDWAHRCHICTGPRLTTPHICTATGLSSSRMQSGRPAGRTIFLCERRRRRLAAES